LELMVQRFVSDDTHYGTMRQSNANACPLAEAHYHFNRQDGIFRKATWGKEMLAPPTGSLPLLRWAQGPLSVPCTLGTPAYRLQVKIKSGACIHVPPCV
jgi:hypothetical protein